MTENYEFIAAVDLPATEAEEVDVLCVENGELKRKPGASLGGGNYDVEVRLYTERPDGTDFFYRGELLAGSYEAALEKINSGKLAAALVHEENIIDKKTGGWWYNSATECYLVHMGQGEEEWLLGSGFDVDFRILPDNTIEVN